ncbi:hypothetical protein [Xanthomonas phage NEB7]|nr:hypothetical protein [Xanthomonas phage NEB7]
MARAPKIDAALSAVIDPSDFVARFARAGSNMRTQVFRAASGTEALELANASIAGLDWELVELLTLEEAKKRRGL